MNAPGRNITKREKDIFKQTLVTSNLYHDIYYERRGVLTAVRSASQKVEVPGCTELDLGRWLASNCFTHDGDSAIPDVAAVDLSSFYIHAAEDDILVYEHAVSQTPHRVTEGHALMTSYELRLLPVTIPE